MTNDEYIKAALRTLSPNFYRESVGSHTLATYTKGAILSLGMLDVIKKKLFYDKGDDVFVSLVDRRLKNYKPDCIDLIHGILGIATEAAELLDILTDILDGEVPDAQIEDKIRDELGDHMWYHAIICHALGTSIEDIQKANIAKLKVRFPEKFTDELAVDRDIEAESAARNA